jgi:hypothetical protein
MGPVLVLFAQPPALRARSTTKGARTALSWSSWSLVEVLLNCAVAAWLRCSSVRGGKVASVPGLMTQGWCADGSATGSLA